jgi:hypothetical protein
MDKVKKKKTDASTLSFTEPEGVAINFFAILRRWILFYVK